MDEKVKSLSDIFAHGDTTEELYTSDQKKRYYRKSKGRFRHKEGAFDFIHLIKCWEEIVGTLMANNTIPLKIYKNTLLVSTKHAVFSQELGFLTPQIIKKIKELFPELGEKITKIKFSHSNYTSFDFQKEQVQEKIQPTKRKKLHPFSPEFLEDHKKQSRCLLILMILKFKKL